MKNSLRKKLTFLLIGFFAFSYQFANLPPVNYKTVEAANNTKVILGGQSIGVNINVDGILILGFSDFYGENGKKCCPSKEAGLKEGDVIVAVNDKSVTTAVEFSNIVDQCASDKMSIEYKRDGAKYSTAITAVKSSEDGKYHIGLWARDGTTGMGTLTFIDPETKEYGALGHGVTDADTGEIITPGKSDIYFASVSGVIKGTNAHPGELQGYFISSEIGDITDNNECGIFGKIDEEYVKGQRISVASRQEVSTGAATIYCCVDGNNVESFSINIDKINIDSKDNKNMVISITDERLITCTGGIVQGMSGSPIVQNGKLVGAVTHVFVNEPTKGYGIFIENMLNIVK